MTIAKAEIKIGTINDLGNKLDDELEVAVQVVERAAGSAAALKQAKSKLAGLYAHIDQDIDEGKIPEEPLAVAKYAKSYVQKAIGVLDNMAITADVAKIRAEGKLEGLRVALGVAKKDMDAEKAKLAGLLTALEEGGSVVLEDGGDIPERAIGVHPGDPLASRRAEAKVGHEPALEPNFAAMDQEALLDLAAQHNIEVSERWSLTRLSRTVEEALRAAHT